MAYTFEQAQKIAKLMEYYIQKTNPDVKCYLVEGHKGATEWTIRFTIPKSTPYFTKGTTWHDPQHKIASDRKKRWKCKKFGKIAFPNDPVKAKELEDRLFKEW